MAYGYPVIPKTITVHLGKPDEPAQNVTVPFVDYIKNVASSEIYPTWPESAIRANIYAEISYALARIYTEYYRSKGYDFDITNTTQYDQAYVYGREIFENISQIVDELFNSYISKRDTIAPLFAQYCNGTTSKCAGLSQWGTVDLAKKGYIPYDILQHYYGNDIDIVNNAPVEDIPESYPGQPLRFGSSGNSVQIIQAELNRIRKNYPAIPKIPAENGVFGNMTEKAVKEFQKIFLLKQDGVVGPETWYKIKMIYSGIKKLNELSSEALEISEIAPVFSTELTLGTEGDEVKQLQYYLNVIAYFNDAIPSVVNDGIYGPNTQEAVSAFQQEYGLPQKNFVDRETWDKLKQVYTSLVAELTPEFYQNKAAIYPGTTLLRGSKGTDVSNLQTYLAAVSDYYGWDLALPITGYFGDQTYQAVKKFQETFGPRVTGVVGPLTWSAIAKQYDAIIGGQE